MKNIALLFIAFLTVVSVSAQSINGNMNTTLEGEMVVLKYGNVDIYNGEKLVKSVITDEYGNFNVKLDTGTYRCVVNYKGFKPIEKNIVVRADESVDFKVAETKDGAETLKKEKVREESRKASVAPMSTGLASYSYSTYDKAPMRAYGGSDEDRGRMMVTSPGSGTSTATYGSLTAGEINDFAKWSLWNQYTNNELKTSATHWNLCPKNRYTVLVQNQDGFPIVNALVKLIADGKSKFETKTDNTGKAELWFSILTTETSAPGRVSMEINVNGKKTTINNVKQFEAGINKSTVEVSCEQSTEVDIAFAFDATGSMGDELSYLQAEMKQIMFDAKKINDNLSFRFANVFYRDTNDEYVTKMQQFTSVLTEASTYIDEQRAGGGGDFPEAVDAALEDALNRLNWNENARTRMLFLILDAPPHNPTQMPERLKKYIEIAAKKGIRIIPIASSGIDKNTEYFLRALALGTNGTYTFLTSHSGIGNGHIDPTTDKYDVETLHNLLVRLIQSFTFIPDCKNQEQEPDLNYPDSSVQYPFPGVLKDSTDTIAEPIRFNPNNSADTLKIEWSYYPNPTNGIVNIIVNRDVEELFISDMTGKELFTIKELKKDEIRRIDLSEYPTGIYLIRYPIGDKWISGKVVLHRTS
jgi:hypothetical protein